MNNIAKEEATMFLCFLLVAFTLLYSPFFAGAVFAAKNDNNNNNNNNNEDNEDEQDPEEKTVALLEEIKNMMYNLTSGNITSPTSVATTAPSTADDSSAEHKKIVKILNQILISGLPPPPIETDDGGNGDGTITTNPTITSNQILIKDNIKNTTSYGEVANSNYTGFYSVPKLFDNSTKDYSSWSQYGKAGFSVLLKEPLKDKVCSVELDVYHPKNQQYTMSIGNRSLSGTLDQDVVKKNIEGCASNVDKINMDFNAPDKFTTLNELKLFKETVVVPPPPPPGPPPIGNNTVFNLNNANATINLANSTIKFGFDESTVIELPDWGNLTEGGNITLYQNETGVNQ